MKQGKDFRREFPPTEESFEQAVQRGLDHLPEAKQRRSGSLRIAVVVTAALLLLTTAGAEIMERFGMGEFIQRSGTANLSHDAFGVLATDFEDQMLDTPYGTVTITEAVYDGMAAYILMEVEPRNEHCMVIPTVPFDGNQAWSFSRAYPKDRSIEAYAESQGYKELLAFQAMGSETTAHFYDSQINDDGTFSLMTWSYVRPEYRLQDELELNLRMTVYHASGNGLGEFETALILPLAGEVQSASSVPEEPVAVEAGGIVVTGVESVTTPMATYILVHCDVTDTNRYREYRTYGKLRFMDENREDIPKGAQPLSLWVYHSRQQMGEGTYYITNRLFDSPPTQISIGFQEGSRETGWTDGEAWTFQLQ